MQKRFIEALLHEYDQQKGPFRQLFHTRHSAIQSIHQWIVGVEPTEAVDPFVLFQVILRTLRRCDFSEMHAAYSVLFQLSAACLGIQEPSLEFYHDPDESHILTFLRELYVLHQKEVFHYRNNFDLFVLMYTQWGWEYGEWQYVVSHSRPHVWCFLLRAVQSSGVSIREVWGALSCYPEAAQAWIVHCIRALQTVGLVFKPETWHLLCSVRQYDSLEIDGLKYLFVMVHALQMAGVLTVATWDRIQDYLQQFSYQQRKRVGFSPKLSAIPFSVKGQLNLFVVLELLGRAFRMLYDAELLTEKCVFSMLNSKRETHTVCLMLLEWQSCQLLTSLNWQRFTHNDRIIVDFWHQVHAWNVGMTLTKTQWECVLQHPALGKIVEGILVLQRESRVCSPRDVEILLNCAPNLIEILVALLQFLGNASLSAEAKQAGYRWIHQQLAQAPQSQAVFEAMLVSGRSLQEQGLLTSETMQRLLQDAVYTMQSRLCLLNARSNDPEAVHSDDFKPSSL